MNKLFLACALLGISLAGCKKENVDPGGTGTEAVSNEWWAMLTDASGDDVFHLGHFAIATYNTASARDSIWVDDIKHGWGMKGKVGVDLQALTFGSPTGGSKNAYFNPVAPTAFPERVTITAGKVLPRAGRSRTGNVTDSIYMEVEFSDDPGTKYLLSGHARTAFAEDEY
ncbi:lipid-binding protein [Flaviaesturariibacter amylovorans]|uniref:Lipid-binding protein n=1 Tax=Flaviaesturariibacter amylovorans TaxID=1084520 RepID=A0ABP8GZ70_9BACT